MKSRLLMYASLLAAFLLGALLAGIHPQTSGASVAPIPQATSPDAGASTPAAPHDTASADSNLTSEI